MKYTPAGIRAVSVVIPAFNEEAAVAGVVTELRDLLGANGLTAEVIIVDDGSTDQTAARAAAAGAPTMASSSSAGRLSPPQAERPIQDGKRQFTSMR